MGSTHQSRRRQLVPHAFHQTAASEWGIACIVSRLTSGFSSHSSLQQVTQMRDNADVMPQDSLVRPPPANRNVRTYKCRQVSGCVLSDHPNPVIALVASHTRKASLDTRQRERTNMITRKSVSTTARSPFLAAAIPPSATRRMGIAVYRPP